MISHITNYLCRINYRMDNDEMFKVTTLVLFMVLSGVLVVFGGTLGIISGLTITFFISSMAIFRAFMQTGKVRVDYSVYNLPNVDDYIVITKDIEAKTIDRGLISAWTVRLVLTMEKGTEWRVDKLLQWEGDVKIALTGKDPNDRVEITYQRTKKSWKTKSEIRDRKLKELLG